MSSEAWLLRNGMKNAVDKDPYGAYDELFKDLDSDPFDQFAAMCEEIIEDAQQFEDPFGFEDFDLDNSNDNSLPAVRRDPEEIAATPSGPRDICDTGKAYNNCIPREPEEEVEMISFIGIKYGRHMHDQLKRAEVDAIKHTVQCLSWSVRGAEKNQ